jgi:hypothetical protein
VTVARARGITSAAIRAGKLVREPCAVCGEEKVDAHHDDYSKPLDVLWLCRLHHNRRHRDMKLQRPRGRRTTISLSELVLHPEVDEPMLLIARGAAGEIRKLGMVLPMWLVDE